MDRHKEIRFPALGIDQSQGFSMQPVGTTVLGTNVRAFEMTEQRARGGQRAGLVKFLDDLVPASIITPNSGVIQHLNVIVDPTTDALPDVFDLFDPAANPGGGSPNSGPVTADPTGGTDGDGVPRNPDGRVVRQGGTGARPPRRKKRRRLGRNVILVGNGGGVFGFDVDVLAIMTLFLASTVSYRASKGILVYGVDPTGYPLRDYNAAYPSQGQGQVSSSVSGYRNSLIDTAGPSDAGDNVLCFYPLPTGQWRITDSLDNESGWTGSVSSGVITGPYFVSASNFASVPPDPYSWAVEQNVADAHKAAATAFAIRCQTYACYYYPGSGFPDSAAGFGDAGAAAAAGVSGHTGGAVSTTMVYGAGNTLTNAAAVASDWEQKALEFFGP